MANVRPAGAIARALQQRSEAYGIAHGDSLLMAEAASQLRFLNEAFEGQKEVNRRCCEHIGRLREPASELIAYLRVASGPAGAPIELKASDEVFGAALAARLEALEAALAGTNPQSRGEPGQRHPNDNAGG